MENHCKNCNKNIHKRRQFCGRSCSATYNNLRKPRRRKIKEIYCVNCSKLIKGSGKKYCNNVCQNEYQYKTKIIPLILSGKCESITLKKYIKNTRGNNCAECGLSNKWKEKELKLQLDHIDGNSDNNDLNNLRLLCPNCHSQTPTYNRTNNENSRRAKYLRKYYKKFKQGSLAQVEEL